MLALQFAFPRLHTHQGSGRVLEGGFKTHPFFRFMTQLLLIMAVILCNIQDNFLLPRENGRVFTHYSDLRYLHDSTPRYLHDSIPSYLHNSTPSYLHDSTPCSARSLTHNLALINKPHFFSTSERRYEKNVMRNGRKQQMNVFGKYWDIAYSGTY